MEFSKGKILISEPFMMDINFKRTVVGLVEHNDEGTVGFILNRMLKIGLQDVLPDFPNWNPKLYYGGPVQPDTLHFMHRIGDIIEGNIEINKNVFWGGNFEALKIIAEGNKFDKNDFRFYLGYSGWGTEQLKVEVEQNAWIVTRAKPDYFFLNNTEVSWRNILKAMGNEYAIMANFPEDPSLN